MTGTPERREFHAEVTQLLDIVIHSLYSNKDVFLRELISNASDALDRLRFEGLTRPELLTDDEPYIRIERDKERRTLSIVDDGIGMSREEVERDIGTIAQSGTAAFLKTALETQPAQHMSLDLPPRRCDVFNTRTDSRPGLPTPSMRIHNDVRTTSDRIY